MDVLKDNSSDGDNQFPVCSRFSIAHVCPPSYVTLQVKLAIPRQMVQAISFLRALQMGPWDLSCVCPSSYLSFVTLTVVRLVSDYAI